jgi:1-acyl-sn-glycerol-3-phosphate acyltransferase
MKNWFYYLVYFIGCQPMWLTSTPLVLHKDRSRRKGAYILACTHFSPYDVAILIYETPRVLDFVSVVEVFRHPLSRWFLSNMGSFPLDRWKPDSGTVRTILDRLKADRVVAMFPEGTLRTEETSVLNGGKLKAGVGRIAKMAGVPILPCVLVGSRAYHRWINWMPFKRIKYGLIYGEPFYVGDNDEADPKVFEERLRKIFQELHSELRIALK